VAKRLRDYYERQVLPRLLNKLSGADSLDSLRRRACAGLAGDVVELGFGSGHNVPFYPAGVTSVAAIEPSDLSWRLAGPRLASSRVPVRRAGLDGQALTLADDSQDAVLSTWTLCTIPDVGAALREVRRVLRPGGTLHFLEHGLAPDASVQRWQRRLDPLERRLVGGCSFVRPIVDLVERAGFAIREVDVFYQEGAPRFSGADSLGVAVSA
jgi:SAM-dependent methyltransferase